MTIMVIVVIITMLIKMFDEKWRSGRMWRRSERRGKHTEHHNLTLLTRNRTAQRVSDARKSLIIFTILQFVMDLKRNFAAFASVQIFHNLHLLTQLCGIFDTKTVCYHHSVADPDWNACKRPFAWYQLMAACLADSAKLRHGAPFTNMV